MPRHLERRSTGILSNNNQSINKHQSINNSEFKTGDLQFGESPYLAATDGRFANPTPPQYKGIQPKQDLSGLFGQGPISGNASAPMSV